MDPGDDLLCGHSPFCVGFDLKNPLWTTQYALVEIADGADGLNKFFHFLFENV
jgi:hypothetical protein